MFCFVHTFSDKKDANREAFKIDSNASTLLWGDLVASIYYSCRCLKLIRPAGLSNIVGAVSHRTIKIEIFIASFNGIFMDIKTTLLFVRFIDAINFEHLLIISASNSLAEYW